jgi:hypothetical protein
MRRAPTIFLAFQFDIGHAYPRRDVLAGNQTRPLTAIGKMSGGHQCDAGGTAARGGARSGVNRFRRWRFEMRC